MNRTIMTVALLLLTTGCTVVGPDYVKPVVDTPQRWRIQPEDAADIANTHWWKGFADPVLNDLVRIALENNRDVRIAAARVAEFAARVDIARSGFYPQIGYDGSAGRNQASRETFGGGSRVNNTFQAGLNVGWELDLWGKIQRAKEGVGADLLAAEEGRRTVILTLVSAVATSYVGLRSLDRQLEIAQATLQKRRGSLTLFEDQLEGGVVSELEVAQARSEYELAAVRVPAIERQIALLENSISVLLGRNPGSIQRGKGIDGLILPPIPEGIPSEVLARRPDIRQAEQNLISANAAIGVARAAYFPNISLTGLFGFASTELSNLLSSSASVWSLGGSLLGPIFAGGGIDAQVRVSEAVQRQVLISYLQAVQTAFREVDDSLISTQKSRQELAAQTRQVDALQEYANLAYTRYNEGYVSYIEVLDAERRLFDTQLEYTRKQRDLYVALISVYKAMGGGWIEQAEATANRVDYPDQGSEQDQPMMNFPRATQPGGKN